MSSYTESFTSVNGDVADATELEAEFDAIATAVNSKVDADGSTSMTGDLAMGSNKITGLATPTDANDGVSKTYMENFGLGESGDEMLWRGGSVPTGWSVQAYNNDALRIISGSTAAYPSAGAKDFTTVFANNYATDAHALTINEMPAHDHSYLNATAAGANIQTGASFNQSTAATTGSTGGGAGHTHTVDLDVVYQDFNVIRKT
jgi:hypothetical protein